MDKFILIVIEFIIYNYQNQNMIKFILIISLITFAFSFQIIGFKFFEDDEPLNLNLLSQDQEQRIHASDDIHMGSAITPDIQSKIKTYIQQAYIFNGQDQIKNIMFIQQKLATLYNGTYVVAIYGGQTNYSEPIFGRNVGISSYSINGEWWIYWKGANHYQPYYSYYVSRQDGNYQGYKCESSNTYPYYNSTTILFSNVVNAAEADFTNIQDLTGEIQEFLSDYSPEKSPSVTAVNSTLPFYICAWNTSDSNYIQRSSRYGFTVVSMPKIG